MEKKVLRGAKSALFRFFAPRNGKVRFLRFGPEKASQNVTFIRYFALLRKQCFLRFKISYFSGNYFTVCDTHFPIPRGIFAKPITSQKCWFGIGFKGCTLFLTPQNWFWALFATSAQHFENLRLCGKVRFCGKVHFVVPMPPMLVKQMVYWYQWAPFGPKANCSVKVHFGPEIQPATISTEGEPKVHFRAKSALFAKVTNKLASAWACGEENRDSRIRARRAPKGVRGSENM